MIPNATKIIIPENKTPAVIPVLTISNIKNVSSASIHAVSTVHPAPTKLISSVPIHLHSMQEYNSAVVILHKVDLPDDDTIHTIVGQQVVNWLCIDDASGSFLAH